jgi:PKD domain
VDLRLRHDSPLIDRGGPAAVEENDLAGELRLVDGDGANGPASDMGAYEYQRRAPAAAIAAPTADGFPPGATVAFSAAGSSDPDAGDSLEYTWSFGDGATATGDAPSHAYDSAGPRTVTLTVTDPTGLTATATKALLLGDPLPGDGPSTGTGGGGDRDETPPVISSASLRGTRVRFRLSEAATVRFSVRRRSGGRRLGSFARRAAAGQSSVRFAGRLRLRGRTVSLAPGRYRLALVATDAAGNRSAARRLAFRVLRRG